MVIFERFLAGVKLGKLGFDIWLLSGFSFRILFLILVVKNFKGKMYKLLLWCVGSVF